MTRRKPTTYINADYLERYAFNQGLTIEFDTARNESVIDLGTHELRAKAEWTCAAHNLITSGDCPECDDELIALADEAVAS